MAKISHKAESLTPIVNIIVVKNHTTHEESWIKFLSILIEDLMERLIVKEHS